MDECFSSGYHDCSMFVFVFFFLKARIYLVSHLISWEVL